MKKITLSIIILIILNFLIFSDVVKDSDDLIHKGKYQEAVTLLKQNLKTDNPDVALIWRIGFAQYEIIDGIPSKQKKEKLDAFAEVITFLRNFLTLDKGDKRDRAQLNYWYTVNYSAKAKVVGISESLPSVPYIRQMCKKITTIDPEFANPYFLEAMVDSKVPGLLGGDKVRMGINLGKTFKYDPDNLTFLLDASEALIERNWSYEKRLKSINDNKISDDYLPKEISDKELGVSFLKKIIELYTASKDPSVKETKKYNEAKIRLAKIK